MLNDKKDLENKAKEIEEKRLLKEKIVVILAQSKGVIKGLAIYEIKTILSCIICLLFNDPWVKIRITFCLWIFMNAVESVNMVLEQPKQDRRLHYRVMVFSLIETSLLLFFIFLVEPNLVEQSINYTSPLRPIKEVFSFIYLCVAIIRALFKGIVVHSKN